MNRIYITIKGALLGSFFFLLIACKKNDQARNYQNIKHLTQLDTYYKTNIENCLTLFKDIDSSKSKVEIIESYKKTKLAFKQNEAIMSFFNAGTYKSLTRPNLPIVDEDDNAEKVISPTGFQVLEELIKADTLDFKDIETHKKNIINLLKLERDNFSFKKAKDYHIIWAIKDNYLRIVSLGISGFDSPILLNSLPEAKSSLEGVKKLLEIYRFKFKDQILYKKQQRRIQNAIEALHQKDFNDFNRFDFIKNKIHPLLELLNKTALDWMVNYPFDRKFANNATSLFTKETFNLHLFSPQYQKVNADVVKLGKELFNDNSLSSKNNLSCFSCHQPEKAFTDGKQFSIANDGSFVKRNAPSLLYSGLQAAQFYDARASSLENQILGVIKDEKEFHNNIDSLVTSLDNNKIYQEKFKQVFNEKINSLNFRHAIASYVRTLSNFNSKFDKNISGLDNNLSPKEINGFNLFMGKAKCATCHFAPIFNGTVPPLYTESELEIIGVPEQVAWKNATIDDDLGRYTAYQTEKKKHAFKTPTIRNSNKTAPYMHNGIYTNLIDVITFYNKGGGFGIGITLDNQTLPPDNLNLANNEVDDLIAFLVSLDDEKLTD